MSYTSAGAYSNHVRNMHPLQYSALYRGIRPRYSLNRHNFGFAYYLPEPESIAGGPVCDSNEEELETEQGPTADSEKEQETEEAPAADSEEEQETEKPPTADFEKEQETEEAPAADSTQLEPLHAQTETTFDAGKPRSKFQFSHIRSQHANLLHPFVNFNDYKVGRWFHQAKVAKTRVSTFFQEGLASTIGVGFKFGHTLRGMIDSMVETPPWLEGYVRYPIETNIESYIRDILDCVKYLIRQRSFVEHLTWAPVCERDYKGSRVYSKLNTGDWWWDT
ncbi:hypothetical protein BDZ91DRAFT_800416 [Kalaharituber pfeilii]|nr:hypothetical protein BDZ91DRAFT_800416 [Kalaharituber pfeilii]